MRKQETLKAIIIDDEYRAVRLMENLLERYFPNVKILGSSTDADQGISFVKNLKPDLLFLDINMPALNGFELLDKLDYNNFDVIFTTAHTEHALRALKLQAFDYLLKPIDLTDLRCTIDRVQEKRQAEIGGTEVSDALKEVLSSFNQRIAVPGKNHIEYVSTSDIVYLEANSNTSELFMVGNQNCINTTRSLKEYEEMLCRENSPFIRIHNSFLINVNHATRYIREDGGYVVMREKKTIPISKQKKDDFLRMINL